MLDDKFLGNGHAYFGILERNGHLLCSHIVRYMDAHLGRHGWAGIIHQTSSGPTLKLGLRCEDLAVRYRMCLVM